MKKIFPQLLLLFLLASSPIFSQDSPVDSLRRKISVLGQDTSRVRALNSLCKAMLSEGDYGVERYANEALILAKQLNDQQGTAASFYVLGRMFYQGENYAKAMENYMEGLRINESIGNKAETARGYSVLGNIYFTMGNTDHALESFKKAEQKAEPLGDDKLLQNIYLNMSNLYISMNNEGEGVKYCLKAKNLAEKTGNDHALAFVDESIGQVWLNERRYDEALKWYTEAKEKYEAMGDKASLVRNGINIGTIYYMKGNTAEALKLHQECEKNAEEIGDKYSLRDIYKSLELEYEDQDNAKQALIYSKKYQAVNDSISNEDFSRKLAQLESQFDKTKMENELEKDKQMIEAQSGRMTSTRYGLLFGIVSFILFVALILVAISGRNRAKYLQEQLDYYANNQFRK